MVEGVKSALLVLSFVLSVLPAHAQLAKRGARDTIGQGRPVDCLFDAPPRQRCTFYPRNGDGSFVLERADGRLVYLTRTGAQAMRVSVSNGRSSADVGTFTRSRDDRACWVRQDRRICAW